MSKSEHRRFEATLSPGEVDLYNRTLHWLREEPRSEEQIALKMVHCAVATYKLTREDTLNRAANALAFDALERVFR